MRRVGDHALLWELPDNPSVHAAARAARGRFGDQLVEIVPGDQTLLLVWEESLEDADPLISSLRALARDASAFNLDSRVIGTDQTAVVTISVTYDGADLGAVAAALDVSPATVVAQHAAADYTVAFVGFAPGFPYLRAEPASAQDVARLLELPRLSTPRTAVPAGSVAVAAGYCGIYPRASPGGWNLLGRTDAVLFDPGRDPPALLEPGTHVRFEPIR
jgi:KipI family sensor histidine kinase inhibitor